MHFTSWTTRMFLELQFIASYKKLITLQSFDVFFKAQDIRYNTESSQ